MVTKVLTKAKVSAPGRKPAVKVAAPKVMKPEPDPAKPNPLRAGLKALGKVRDDVVQHQSRVFEAILGIEPGTGWSGLVKRDAPGAKVAQEALGLRKFEAVFDQRVASALERMGMPSMEALQSMRDELDTLRAEVAALKAKPRKR
jgi:poly(hydroxyalkanoate) granule associated protein phasin